METTATIDKFVATKWHYLDYRVQPYWDDLQRWDIETLPLKTDVILDASDYWVVRLIYKNGELKSFEMCYHPDKIKYYNLDYKDFVEPVEISYPKDKQWPAHAVGMYESCIQFIAE